MIAVPTSRSFCALLLALAPAVGCYSGLDGFAASVGDEGIGPDADGGLDDGGDGGDDDGDGGDDQPRAACAEPSVTPVRLGRMTRSQYDHTIRDLLGIEGSPASALEEDEHNGPFAANRVAPVGQLTVEQYKAVAESLAAEAATDLTGLVPCDPSSGSDACAQQFIEEFGLRAYRRPLTATDIARYTELYASGEDFNAGIRLVIQSMLQSPHFLYFVEGMDAPEGDRAVEVGPYALATRLSYFLWDTTPDDALLAAAASGELDTPEGARAQAERLLADPRAADAIGNFVVQLLEVQSAAQLDKDPDFFPAYDVELGEEMQQDLARFTDYVVREGDGRLDTLLTGSFTFADGPLLDVLGVQPPPGYVPGDPIALPPQERAGWLTHPAVLAVHAHANQTSPVGRGALVRENVLCQPLPPPPPDVDDTPPEVDPNATLREQLAQHRDSPSCSGCHDSIDGIGLGFEAYDGIGRFRTEEAGQPVDASGSLIGTGDNDGEFETAVELVDMLADNDRVRSCMTTQWLRFALARDVGEADACSVERATEVFADSDYNVRELILAIISSDAFRFRSEVTP